MSEEEIPAGWLSRGTSLYPEEWDGVVIVPTDSGYVLCTTDWETLGEPLFEAPTQAACAAWWTIEQSNGAQAAELTDWFRYHAPNMKAKCRSCGRYYEYEGSVNDFDPSMSYCGANQWCTP